MSDDRIIAVISLVAFLILVVSGLVRRRLATRTWLGLALVWVAIFALAAIVAMVGLRTRS